MANNGANNVSDGRKSDLVGEETEGRMDSTSALVYPFNNFFSIGGHKVADFVCRCCGIGAHVIAVDALLVLLALFHLYFLTSNRVEEEATSATFVLFKLFVSVN